MIYLLSKNFRMGCKQLCDKHLTESIVDTGMAVSFYLWNHHRESVAFDASHYFHDLKDVESNIPRALYPIRGTQDLYNWVVINPSNYAFLIQYLIELTEEYLYRFSRDHKLAYMIRHLPKKEFNSIVNNGVIENRIAACLELYKEPSILWKWTNRDKPRYVI